MLKKTFLSQLSVFKALFFCFLLLFSHSTYAIQVNVGTMIQNLGLTIPALLQLVTAIAYVMGFLLVIKGIMGMKELGETRTARMDHRTIMGPLASIFVGTMLIYIPSSIQVGLSTFWSDPTPYAYVVDAEGDSWWEFINTIFLILQFIGTIAFIRGLLVLSHLGQSHQQGGFGKAMAYIVSGVLLINMYDFLQSVYATLGIGQ